MPLFSQPLPLRGVLSFGLWIALAPCFPGAAAAPQDSVPLRTATLTFSDRAEANIRESLAHSARFPGEVFARLQPVGVQSPQVQYLERGPRGGPWYRLDGIVSVGPISLRTFLAGDVTIRDSIPCKPGQPLGYSLKLSFESSDSWIQENAGAVIGNLCTETRAGQIEVSLEGFMIEGPDFGGVRGRKLKSLLADQVEPLLRAMLPLRL